MLASSYHNSIDEALETLKKHEMKTCTKFIRVNGHMTRLTGPAGKNNLQRKQLCFDGVLPYIKDGSTTLHCLHGSDKHVPEKNREKNRKLQLKDGDHPDPKCTRRYIQDTYKLGCPAKVTLTKQLILDAYQEGIDMRNLKNYRKRVTAKVKEALMNQGDAPRVRVRYVLTLPELQVHAGHPVGKDNPGYLPMNEKIQEKTKQIVTELHVTDTGSVKTHLEDFVNNTIFQDDTKPPKTNQRFFPHPKTLKNCIDKVLAQALYHDDDQENLEAMLRHLPPDNRWKLNKATEDGGSFLLVHQTLNQQKLLKTYGNELCLLDATYKTSKYAMPMFFVVVRTNTVYQIVATFIVADESINSISQAIQELKFWNPEWQPRTWMTDCCAAEIRSIENIFPEAAVLVCDFHRLQAWNRWLVKLTNGVSKSDAEELQKLLKKVAQSNTEEVYNITKKALEDSVEWKKYDNFVRYMEQTWFVDGMEKRWVRCYRSVRLLRAIRTNNGIEAINGAIKTAIKGARRPTLSALFGRVLRWITEIHYDKYVTAQHKLLSQSRKYAADIPPCLHERPHDFVKHIMRRLDAARQLLDTQDTGYDADTSSCTCEDFYRNTYPCKHILRHWLDEDGNLSIPSSDLDPWISTQPLPTSDQESSGLPDHEHEHDDGVESSAPREAAATLSSNAMNDQLKDIRSIIENLKSWTYLTNSPTAVQQVHDTLTSMKGFTTSATTVDHSFNLPVAPTCPRKRRQISGGVLKAKRRRPLKYRNRVGADHIVKSLEECMPATNYTTNKPTQLHVPVISKLPFSPAKSSSTLMRGKQILAAARSRKKAMPTRMISTPLPQNPHEKVLHTSYWFSTDEMELVVNLFHHQWPGIAYQTPLYVQRQYGFDPVPSGKYAQILHTHDSHWLAVTNIGTTATIRVMDSLGYDLDYRALRGIASLHKTTASHLRLRFEEVQRQLGASDCGLFAVAFLVELLSGSNPAKVTYDQAQLRHHMYKCLEEGRFTEFPRLEALEDDTRRIRPRTMTIKLYCICRMPWDSAGLAPGIECDLCGEWFHLICINMAESYVDGKKSVPYSCKACVDGEEMRRSNLSSRLRALLLPR